MKKTEDTLDTLSKYFVRAVVMHSLHAQSKGRKYWQKRASRTFAKGDWDNHFMYRMFLRGYRLDWPNAFTNVDEKYW